MTDFDIIVIGAGHAGCEAARAAARMGQTVGLCVLDESSLARRVYNAKRINERHRHRYEFNNSYRELLASKGMVFGGLSPDGKLVEAVELQGHPWFIGVQFHPEFKSRPFDCHPLFAGFIEAGIQRHTASPGPTSRESSKNDEAQP